MLFAVASAYSQVKRSITALRYVKRRFDDLNTTVAGTAPSRGPSCHLSRRGKSGGTG